MLKNIFKYGLFSLVLGSFFMSCNNSTNESLNLQSEDIETPTNKKDTVVIEEMQFKPQELIVNAGDTVVFVNRDIVAHDATSVDSTWKSLSLQPSETWMFVPTESSEYFCSIHLIMKGKVIVN